MSLICKAVKRKVYSNGLNSLKERSEKKGRRISKDIRYVKPAEPQNNKSKTLRMVMRHAAPNHYIRKS